MEREWRDQIHAMMEMGERQRTTLKEALEGFKESKKNTASERYALHAANVLNEHFPTHLNIDEIQPWHLTKFKSKREQSGSAAQTIKHNFQALRGACQWAKDNGYLVKELEYPKLKIDNKRLRFLSIEEEQRLLAELDPKIDLPYRPSYEHRPAKENRMRQDNYDLVILLLDTGARYGEIAGITWDRIDMVENTINLWRPKVKNESIICMTSRVREVLQRRSEEKQSEYVFTNDKGDGPRNHATMGIRRALERANINNFTIHDFRHTCASRLVQNGLSLYEVASILGHTDVQTTQRYAHLESRDVSQRARDIMEALNSVPDSSIADSDAGIVGQGT
jgi:integrase